jgi:predicted MPP superfamily phosphohydrolase
VTALDWAGAAAVAAAAYAIGGEPYWIRATTYVLDLPAWPAALNGLTVVQLSDLHGRTTAFHRSWVRQWLDTADLIAVTGDLFSPTIPRRRVVRWLSHLPAERTRFVSGNHDYRRGRLALAPWTPRPGVLLDNRWELRQRRGVSWAVAGLPDLVKGQPDWEALADLPADLPAVLLCHRPDVVLDPRARRFRLVLAGHTHGGQVALPGFGPVLRHSRLARGETTGLVRRRDQYLVISRGLGTSELPVRFLSRPEVVRIVLRTGSLGEDEAGMREAERGTIPLQ